MTYQGTDELPPPYFDPEGPRTLVDTSTVEVDPHPGSPARRWLDEPNPGLGGATPREAAASGRHAEVRALLAGMEVRDQRLFEELGVTVPT